MRALLDRLLFSLFLVAMVGTAAPAKSASQTHLVVDVRLTPDAHGELAYLIFNSPSGFPGDPQKAIRHGFVPIPAGARELRVETDLPPGIYAVSVYEDLNGNHKLDRKMLGIPR